MSDRPEGVHLELANANGPRFIALGPNVVCRFGRGPDNTVVVSDQLVSRNHALIDCRESGDYLITDLGSRNGTLLNGVRVVVPTRLTDGDRITVGEQTFVFRQPRNEANTAMGSSALAEPTVVHVSLEVISVLVIDIQDYTHWSRTLGAEKLSAVIGSMVQQADVMLRQNGVWGQKYIGDAVMAIWKHGKEHSNTATLRQVLKSAVELFRIVSGLNTQFGFDSPMRIGAGINTGPASLGNMGGDGTADYTALGDAVNKAFRLEAATRSIQADILIGDSSREWLDPGLQALPALRSRSVALKGYPEPQSAWQISVHDLQEFLVRQQ